jgi:hypothetical protein
MAGSIKEKDESDFMRGAHRLLQPIQYWNSEDIRDR